MRAAVFVALLLALSSAHADQRLYSGPFICVLPQYASYIGVPVGSWSPWLTRWCDHHAGGRP